MSSFSLYWMLEKIVSQCKTISMDYGGYLEKEMATHSSVLAWRIPGTGKPGGLHRVDMTEVT